jgi:hypothetical protein
MASSPPQSLKPTKGDNGVEIKHDLKEVLGNLIRYLIEDFNVQKEYPPAIILSFDEAHSLTAIKKHEVDGSWSNFSELRRALRAIQLYPCFSVFLSTTGKVHQFTPDASNDPSNRLQEGVLQSITPFCELGFDQLAEKVRIGKTTLEAVSSPEFIAKLGRPL